jgi:hypothetical protein
MSKDDRKKMKSRNSLLSENKTPLSPHKPVLSRHLSMFTNTFDHDEIGHNGNGPATASAFTPKTEALFAAVDIERAFQTAVANSYSPELQTLLSNIRFSGQNSAGTTLFGSSAEIASQLLQQQPCRVASVAGGNKMGIEATDDIITHQPLMEFNGNVMLRDQYDQSFSIFTCAQPYVLFYTKLDGLDLCVDARTYGNDARYVRRSCTPNAEVLIFFLLVYSFFSRHSRVINS